MVCLLGLAALASADVSHLKQPQDQQSFGNNQHRYWWLDTEISPFTRKRQTVDHNELESLRAASGCALGNCGLHQQQHNTQQHQNLHNTQQHQQQPIQNPFNTLHHVPQHQNIPSQSNDIYAHMATLSGSPSEVNNLMTDTTQQFNNINSFGSRYDQHQRRTVPCYGASQVCAPNDACSNGYISESNLGLVLSQSNVSKNVRLFHYAIPEWIIKFGGSHCGFLCAAKSRI